MREDDNYWILLSRYISEGLPADQTEELFSWINADPERMKLLQQMQSAWDQSNTYQEIQLNDLDTEAAWTKVRGQLQSDSPAPKIADIRPLRWLSAAAAIVLFCFLGWFSYQTYDQNQLITASNNQAEKKELVLPDGSKIWLNEGAVLSYKKGLAQADKREVSLQGEAFFEVEHNPEKPFLVHTGELETQVLGTSFNVHAEKSGAVKVAVITGKVSFKQTAKEGVFLLPGEEGNFDPAKGISKTAFKNANFLYWKDQSLSFDNEKLSVVLQELERIYKIQFNVNDENLLNQEITTSFKAAPIEEVITVLESLLDLKFVPSGDAYIVVK